MVQIVLMIIIILIIIIMHVRLQAKRKEALQVVLMIKKWMFLGSKWLQVLVNMIMNIMIIIMMIIMSWGF